MLTRRTKRQIEWAFYEYKANKTLGAQRTAEIAEQGLTADLERIGFGSGVSQPTESKAIRLMSRMQPYLWAKVVENTLAAFRFESVYDVLIERYFHRKGHKELLAKYMGSERGYYYSLDRALEFAYMWALEYGLL